MLLKKHVRYISCQDYQLSSLRPKPLCTLTGNKQQVSQYSQFLYSLFKSDCRIYVCIYIWYMIYDIWCMMYDIFIWYTKIIYIHIHIYIYISLYIYVHIKHRIEVIFHWMSGQDQLLESRCWRFVSRRAICSAVGEWMRAQLRRCRVGHGVQLGRRCKRFLGVLMAGKSLQNGGFSGKVMYKRWLNGKMIRHPRSYQRLAHMDSQNEVKYINRFSNKRGLSRGICNIRGK